MAESSPGHLHNVSSQLSPLGNFLRATRTRDRAGRGPCLVALEEGDSSMSSWSGRFHLGSIPVGTLWQVVSGMSRPAGSWDTAANWEPAACLAPARANPSSPFPPLDPQAPFFEGQGYRFNQGETGELSSVEGKQSYIPHSRRQESLSHTPALKTRNPANPWS